MEDNILNDLEARSRRTGETFRLRVSGNVVDLVWSRGRGRRSTRLYDLDAESTLADLLRRFADRVPPEPREPEEAGW
jgi:hypothetical protein